MFEMQWSVPTRLFLGGRCMQELGNIVSQQGATCVVVTGKASSRTNGALEECRTSLKENGVRVSTYSGVTSNARYAQVVDIAQLARDVGADSIVGVGGGSAMDAARAASIASTHGGDYWDYRVTGLKSIQAISPAVLPVFTVPTAAGTGAEMSPAALITRERRKEVFFSPHLFPAASFVKPEYSVSVPQALTAQIGFDAFIQGIEAFVSPSATPFSDIFALAAVRTSYNWLPQAFENPANLEARTEMFVAAIMSLLAINQAGVGGIHALSTPLSGLYDLHHGLALSLVAQQVINHNWKYAPERFSSLDQAIKFEKGTSDQSSCQNFSEKLQQWMENLGLIRQLNGIHIQQGDIDELVAGAQNPDIMTNPGKLTPTSIREIFESVA